MSFEPTPPLFAVALALTAAAGYRDLRSGLIPNRLLAVAAALLLALRVLLGALEHGPSGALVSVGAGALGMLATGLVPLLLYRLQGIGGGDVKLLATLGFALGPNAGLEAELYAFACLLLYAPARLLYEGSLLRTLSASGQLLIRPFTPALRRAAPRASAASFRFAPAVFLATVLSAALHWGAP
jgi:Flp pilus assembly protein protease CpaA